MARLSPIVAAPLTALLICLAAAGAGLGANALRPGGLQLVAPFPYEQDCPEKIDLSGPTISPEQAEAVTRTKDGRTLFIDARPAEAYEAGHIPGARSLPYSFISPVDAGTAGELRAYAHLIVYCDSPDEQLARLQAGALQKLGLPSVKILRGGWPAYKKRRVAP